MVYYLNIFDIFLGKMLIYIIHFYIQIKMLTIFYSSKKTLLKAYTQYIFFNRIIYSVI